MTTLMKSRPVRIGRDLTRQSRVPPAADLGRPGLATVRIVDDGRVETCVRASCT